MVENVFHAQLDHSAWMIGRMIDTAQTLNDEQFRRPTEFGPPPGSVQFFLSHLINTYFFLADIFQGMEERDCRSRVEYQETTPADLRRLLPIADGEMRRALAALSRRQPLTDELKWEWCGQKINGITALAHMIYHTARHGAECLEAMKFLGCEIPELWPISWAGERDLAVPSGYSF